MARWTFEPGHTAAEFKARHMMVTWVRGHFANIHGTLQFDPEAPLFSSICRSRPYRRRTSANLIRR